MSQHFHNTLFLAMEDPYLIFYYLSITFPQQILGGKLLFVLNYDHHLKLCIKKKKPAQED